MLLKSLHAKQGYKQLVTHMTTQAIISKVQEHTQSIVTSVRMQEHISSTATT